ncbi:MAG: hypothetical protein WC859_04615 [Elusimicrobiota bacterium]|jgi:hypothetical protein
MTLILWIAGLWALITGRMTLSPSIQLRGIAARVFGATVLAYTLLMHPFLVSWLLKYFPVSIADETSGSSVPFLISQLVLTGCVLWGLGKLCAAIYQSEPPIQSKKPPVASTGFLVLVGCILLGAIGAYQRVARKEPHGTSLPSEDGPNDTNLNQFLQAANSRITSSRTIAANVGTPMEVTPIPRRDDMSSVGPTSMFFLVQGPRGRGKCRFMFFPASVNLDKKGHYFLYWKFNNRWISILDSIEPTNANIKPGEENINLPGIEPQAIDCFFTSALDHNNNPVDHLDKATIKKGEIIIYSAWDLEAGRKYSFVGRIYDGAGREVLNYPVIATPQKKRWYIWFYHSFNPDRDKPGKWQFVIEANGKKYIQKWFPVTNP